MSWAALLALAGGAYGFKAAGAFLGGRVAVSHGPAPWLALLPPALLAALVTVQTIGGDRAIELDARLAGVAVGGVAAYRRAPFVVVLVVAAAVTAGIRAVS